MSRIQEAFEAAEAVGLVGENIRETLEMLCFLIDEAVKAGEIPVLVGPQLEGRVVELANAFAIEFVGSPTPTTVLSEVSEVTPEMTPEMSVAE